MASLDRAYGIRGAAIALGAAALGGLVHGVLASQLEWLGPKALLLIISATVLVISGTVSARQSYLAAGLIATAMAVTFFWMRWFGYSLMSDASAFAVTAPWDWPAYLSGAGVTLLWVLELGVTFCAALFGCMAGHERAA